MPAKYPVDIGDEEGIVDAVNYLLSGPAGLGQNFAGFSSSTEAYLTGNFRIPFTQTAIAQLYVAPISLSNAEQLDDRTIKYTFTTPQASPPFSLGNGLTVENIDPVDYNSDILKYAGTGIGQIGVIECTTTYVIVRTVTAITGTLPAYVLGGDISYSITDVENSTDANARVTVTGGQDRVFIAAQLDQLISYDTASTQDLTVYVSINRYVGFLNNDPTNPDYLFNLQDTVVMKKYTYTGLTGTGTLPLIETVFASVIDKPDPGFYWYILEVYFKTAKPAQIQVTEDLFGLRSLSAQVVKQ
jgi:hypothetical protein